MVMKMYIARVQNKYEIYEDLLYRLYFFMCELDRALGAYQGYFLRCHWGAALWVTLFQLPVILLVWESPFGTTSSLGSPCWVCSSWKSSLLRTAQNHQQQIMRKKTKLINSTPSAKPRIELQISGKHEQSTSVGHVPGDGEVAVVDWGDVDFVDVGEVVFVEVLLSSSVVGSAVVVASSSVVSISVVVSKSVVVSSSVVVGGSVGSGGGRSSSETPNHLIAANSTSAVVQISTCKISMYELKNIDDSSFHKMFIFLSSCLIKFSLILILWLTELQNLFFKFIF